MNMILSIFGKFKENSYAFSLRMSAIWKDLSNVWQIHIKYLNVDSL